MKIRDYLNEKLITLGNKRPAYNNVVFLAGGAGSGKGFIKDKLLGIEGKSLDVDAIKKLAMGSIKFAKKVKDETGYDIKTMDLRKPENVSLLHGILKDYDLVDKRYDALFKSIALKPDNKPNIIFDVTLASITKLYNHSVDIEMMGYDKKNVHLVWIINDFRVALEQNKNRDRIVPEDILIDTHKGAASTMRSIIDMGPSLKKYIDGDVWLVFNKIFVDIKLARSEEGGEYVTDINYFKIKEVGKPIKSFDEISDEIKQKIHSYVPKINVW